LKGRELIPALCFSENSRPNPSLKRLFSQQQLGFKHPTFEFTQHCEGFMWDGTSGSSFNLGFSEQLKFQRLARLLFRNFYIALVTLLCVFFSSTQTQAQSGESSISAYAEAIKKSTIAERITAMDHYLSIAGGSNLKVDALEFLIWDHLRLNHQSQSVQRAQQLIGIAPANPIAMAVLNQNAPATPLGKVQAQSQLASLKSAMNNLDHLSKPEGMVDRNFQVLKQQVAVMLTGATGLCYLQIEDYADARPALQQAVTNDPNNPQWVYGLALALLNGKNRDQYRGYWYLARASNLAGGTPQGQQIASYGRTTYRKDGGKDAGWDRFLASAAALDAPPSAEGTTVASASTANPANSRATSTTAANSNSSNTNTASAQPAQPTASQPSTKASTTNSSKSSSDKTSFDKTKTSSGFEATLHEPLRPEPANAPAPPPNRPKVMAAPSEAVSLGIMIETSLLTNENREAIIATLKDIVRNMRSNDEACILVFSDQLDFEQDLTADDKLLEDAIGQIRPKPGKALLPGIAFAAGHLKRIGKNANRILLVISDGRSNQANADTLQFRSQVTGVRIDCIGVNAGSTEQALLERLSGYSGGKASFASGPGEFRTVALQMTRTMGIAVP
jgi:tetratricopeptide (TPR) repeat protein